MIVLGIIKILCDISSHLKDGEDTEDKNVCQSFKLNLRLFIALNKLKPLKVMQNTVPYMTKMQVSLEK